MGADTHARPVRRLHRVGPRVAIRRERLQRDRGLSAAEADRIIASQMPADAKRAQSDIVIDNAGSLEALRMAARAAWERLVARA